VATNDNLPAFPFFEISDVEAAFGCDSARYVGTKGEGSTLERQLREESKAANGLFFNGGTLEQYGFKVRDELDRAKVYQTIGGLLRSFDCSHEQKAGTVALAIHRWCDRVAPTPQVPA